MMDSLGWQGALRGLGEDIVKGRPDLGGKIGIPSDVREGGGYPQKLEDFLPGFTPAWIREPLTRLSDSLYEDALKPRYIEEYREGDPTWIQDWNPYWKPDWNDSNLTPEQRAFPDKWDQSSGVYTDEILPRPIPGQLGPALAQTGMEPYVGSTPVSQALQGIFPEGAPTSLMEPAQPPRSLPIGTPGWQPDIPAQTIDPALAAELTYATVDPRQVGLDVFDPGRVTAAQENIAGRLERGENVAEITQAMTNPALLTESVRGGAWGKLRDFLISPAQAKNTSIFKSPRVAVEQPEDTTLSDLLKAAKTETGDVAINRLMDLREPRPVRFSDPDDVRRDNAMRLARAPAVLTNEEEMASDVAIALANAKPRPRGMPAPSVTGELQALTELAKTDPSISDRYTTPGSQALQDITTQVESFSEPTVEWTPPTASDRRKDRAIEKAAEASRKAEAKREADTKKKAAEQRAALDSASQRALQNHMAWMATQAAKRAEEERLRALRGYGSGAMWT
jgi:hypothetical protein